MAAPRNSFIFNLSPVILAPAPRQSRTGRFEFLSLASDCWINLDRSVFVKEKVSGVCLNAVKERTFSSKGEGGYGVCSSFRSSFNIIFMIVGLWYSSLVICIQIPVVMWSLWSLWSCGPTGPSHLLHPIKSRWRDVDMEPLVQTWKNLRKKNIFQHRMNVFI